MHAAAINLRGGVSPRNTRLRGQSIIEYVLIIAIIGLVIVFAGPGVAGAIRNQFNLVGNTVNSGTTGGTEGGASGGGSTGADSTTVQAAIAKDAKDWTLDEQEAVDEDVAAKGEASPAYAKAKAAMDAGTKFSVKLTNGKTLEYRIIGIDHDDLADGSGKAGLTFEATNDALDGPIDHPMNATDTNAGGWEKSELHGRFNSGDLWSLLPSELQSKAKAVTKMTDNKGGGSAGAPSATTDKFFLLSMTEVYGDLQSDGTQYEYFKSKGVTKSNYSGASLSGYYCWTRSVSPSSSGNFRCVYNYGDWAGNSATTTRGVFPAWCL